IVATTIAATTDGGSSPLEDFPPLPNKDKLGAVPIHIGPRNSYYADLLKPHPILPQAPKVPPKSLTMYAITGKFWYGNPDVQELRKKITGQCGIKSDSFYVKAKENYWQMRTLRWDPWFELDIKTTNRVAWISFPDLPPNFFAKECGGETINCGYGD
ncbi:hypothetical protein MTR67_012070, partial [Solanum verrucosum]